MRKYLLFFFIAQAFLFITCDSTKQASKLKMVSPNAGVAIKKGEDIIVKLEIPSSLKEADSIIYMIDGREIDQPRNSDSVHLLTQNMGLGPKTIGAKVYKNGVSESVFSNVVVLPEAPILYSFKVLNEYPHDPEAFTQGLEFKNGFLYESTGQYGLSSLRKTDLKTGKILKKINLANEFFGEGLTIIGNKIYQLTWLENKGLIYDL